MNSKATQKILFLWLPVVVWAGIIFWFSSRPAVTTSQIDIQDFITKKTAHFVEYGIFATLLFRAFKGMGMKLSDAFAYAFFFAVFYAITDEVHQSFTPGREPTLRDVIIDTLGAGITLLCIKNLLPKAPPKLKLWANKLGLI